jgi:hypothetical protein
MSGPISSSVETIIEADILGEELSARIDYIATPDVRDTRYGNELHWTIEVFPKFFCMGTEVKFSGKLHVKLEAVCLEAAEAHFEMNKAA